MPFNFNGIQFIIGVILAVVVAMAAHRMHALSRSGMVAAALLGIIFMGLGGWQPSILLLTFFLSSSLLSRLFRGRKLLLDEKFSKGSERDAWQVLANGGIAGGFVLLGLFLPDAAWTWAGCAAALAAANADTWGTELGVLSPRQPRLITNFKPVSPGTSGGISLTGIVAGLLGASLVALPGALFWQPAISLSFTSRFGLLALAGLIGSLIDSILGATIQAIYTLSLIHI